MDVENLEGDDLARFVYQRTGITRKPATRSVTTVIISGAAGSVITKGDLISTETVDFEILEDAVIPDSGQVSVLASSVLFGAIGNVPSGVINRFPVTISGLVNVYNPEPVTNGYEAEPDEDLRQRYYDKLQRPGKAGNKYHYLEWAKEVVGVGDARVVPRWNGPLTVKVIVIDSNKQPASEELVEDVFTHIESERPFGADVTVVGAAGVPINITATLSLVEGYTEELAIENIKKNITRYLQSLAFKSPFISYAKIGSEIIDSEGVLDYQNLMVNGGIANIPIGDEQVAIMGGVNEG
nr:baseplate J/gp47 family protein [Sporosarcina cyprini]